jgi:hypothetical protein
VLHLILHLKCQVWLKLIPINRLESGPCGVPGLDRTRPTRPLGRGSVIKATLPLTGSVAEPTIRNSPAWIGKGGNVPAATWSASRSQAGLEMRNATRSGQNVNRAITGVIAIERAMSMANSGDQDAKGGRLWSMSRRNKGGHSALLTENKWAYSALLTRESAMSLFFRSLPRPIVRANYSSWFAPDLRVSMV